MAEFFVFVDFHLYYTEPDSPHGVYTKVGAYLLESSLTMGDLFDEGAYYKGLNRGGD